MSSKKCMHDFLEALVGNNLRIPSLVDSTSEIKLTLKEKLPFAKKQHFQQHCMHLLVEVEELVILEDYMDINISVVILTTTEDML